MPSEILRQLRAATSADHQRLERFLALEWRTSELGRYRDLLTAFLTYYEPLETALGRLPWNGSGVDFEDRRKAGWLRSDLAHCGPAAGEVGPRAEVPPVPDLPAAFGALYVTEGATLGGRQILRGLASTLPRRFFASYGEAVPERWNEFLGALERQAAASAEASAAIVRTARDVFAGLRAWFQRTLPAAL